MDPVCIVGAGPAGLASAAALKKEQIPFQIVDSGLEIGGIWDIDRPETPMYRSAHFISSRSLSGFPGFPMPESYPDYPRHDLVLRYIRSFAQHHGLLEDALMETRVVRASPTDRPGRPETWSVTLRRNGSEERRVFSGLILATGANWHPNVPTLPGHFDGEIRHSFHYRDPEEFRGLRVLIVGGGNSGVDIACDAARTADRAFLSLRRGYRFVPKYVFGTPADVFAHGGPPLPAWLERRVFSFLLDRILVGDLRRYGLPRPDHHVLASHPIMNTQVLHHLGHGDLEARPDVERLDGDGVRFVDGTRDSVDLMILATGYRRPFPFLELPGGPAAGQEIPPEDLYLNLLHRRHPTLFLLGLFETDGAAYGLFGAQAHIVAKSLLALAAQEGEAARRLAALRAEDRPDLAGGRTFVDSPRHRYYVTDRAYRRALRNLRREMGWPPAS
jgi:hypothetical protein